MILKNNLDSIKPDNWIVNSLLFLLSFAFFSFVGYGENVWYDEGVTLFYSNKTFYELIEFSKVDNNPPLYNILLFFWSKLFGYSIWTSRTLSIIIMSTSSVMLYKIGRMLYGSLYAIISIFFFAVINLIKYHSIEIRAYGLMLLLSLFCIYFLVKLYKTNNFKYFLSWIIAMCCLFFTHYASVIFLMVSAVLILPYLFTKGNTKANLWKILALVIGTLGPIVYWMRFPLGNAKTMSNDDFWLKPPDWEVVKYTLSELCLVLGVDYKLYIALIVGCILIAMFQKSKTSKRISFGVLFLLILIPTLSYFISQNSPMFGTRYLIFLIPIILIAFFHMVSNLPGFLGKIVVLGLLIQIMVNPSEELQRPNYTELFEYVEGQVGENKLIFLNESRMVLPYLINQYGNVFRTDKSLADKCIEDNLIPTTVKDFSSAIGFDYLRAYKEILYIRGFGGSPDPDGIITKKIEDDFDLIKTNNDIYDFHTQYFIRKANVEAVSFVSVKLDESAISEGFKIEATPFDKQPDIESFNFSETTLFGLKTIVDLSASYKLNQLSVLKIEVPLNVKKMNLDCFVVVETIDEIGQTVLYKSEKINDQNIVYNEWKTYVLHVPIGNQNGRTIKCYFWNKSGSIFSARPMEVSLENLIKEAN